MRDPTVLAAEKFGQDIEFFDICPAEWLENHTPYVVAPNDPLKKVTIPSVNRSTRM